MEKVETSMVPDKLTRDTPSSIYADSFQTYDGGNFSYCQPSCLQLRDK